MGQLVQRSIGTCFLTHQPLWVHKVCGGGVNDALCQQSQKLGRKHWVFFHITFLNGIQRTQNRVSAYFVQLPLQKLVGADKLLGTWDPSPTVISRTRMGILNSVLQGNSLHNKILAPKGHRDRSLMFYMMELHLQWSG